MWSFLLSKILTKLTQFSHGWTDCGETTNQTREDLIVPFSKGFLFLLCANYETEYMHCLFKSIIYIVSHIKVMG